MSPNMDFEKRRTLASAHHCVSDPTFDSTFRTIGRHDAWAEVQSACVVDSTHQGIPAHLGDGQNQPPMS